MKVTVNGVFEVIGRGTVITVLAPAMILRGSTLVQQGGCWKIVSVDPCENRVPGLLVRPLHGAPEKPALGPSDVEPPHMWRRP